ITITPKAGTGHSASSNPSTLTAPAAHTVNTTELVLTLGSQMVVLANKAETLEEARAVLIEAIDSGAALEKFKTFIKNQGGDKTVIDHPERLPQASTSNNSQVTATPTESKASEGSSVNVNDHLKQTAQRESGGNIHAVNPTSGAAGKYQFLQSTWDSVAPA
ncbi:transglycosylase family protein, partial [Staphylococcus aureus]|uniref:transglycosylase family protein n=1 Tax=Staphylococcus aureus TaxID=1280 RepID=UPI00210B60B0